MPVTPPPPTRRPPVVLVLISIPVVACLVFSMVLALVGHDWTRAIVYSTALIWAAAWFNAYRRVAFYQRWNDELREHNQYLRDCLHASYQREHEANERILTTRFNQGPTAVTRIQRLEPPV